LFGDKGFGFDPLFIPDGSDKTFAQDIKNKNIVSHRRKSVEQFCKHIAGAGV
ncbi:MAG: non-canonical purine NTP pyrophosphatase, partial [Candidatus Altiarchaeota archaeon]|nr:non-canonical purine NTP pyrophosphatase [Candidatus Altiarchaeota archaeon]